MMTADETSTQQTGHYHEIRAERHLNAPIDRVWFAWSDAEQLEHWFTDRADIDFRIGGRYRNSDGDEGEYLEIVPEKHISFTWEQPDYAPGSIVTVDFVPDGDNGTILRLEHSRVACDDAEDLEIGWTWSLDSLTAFINNGLGLRFEEWVAMRGM
ncbi:MAG: SRPBCC domain-containing protein [Bacteroidetes bacterium]|nr:SRPBCC domain-containing protein [Bacteroidota bacterium]